MVMLVEQNVGMELDKLWFYLYIITDRKVAGRTPLY